MNGVRHENNFLTEGDYVVVYTDGSCKGNGDINAKAGIGVFWNDNHELNVSERIDAERRRKPETNSSSEILACIKALEVAFDNNIKKLKIITDCKFIVTSMNDYIERWKINGWKKTDGTCVVNKDDFMTLDSARQRLLDVKWEHCLRDSCPGNIQANALAQTGAEI